MKSIQIEIEMHLVGIEMYAYFVAMVASVRQSISGKWYVN